ncbi:MAG: ACT domain-containing protein [Actinomycetota bacterium]|nr:ACT domain-containing protein [Actinomycetota bacterium]
MRANIVFTLTGPDRVGIVEEVTGALLEADANVETSRMARLGGEFAILMLLTVPEARRDEVESALAYLGEQGYTITTRPAGKAVGQIPADRHTHKILVEGADHEGIIHEIAQGLSQRGINIESMETGTTRAPVSGTPLFTMTALVAVPPEVDATDWCDAVVSAGQLANVDVTISPADSPGQG